MATFLMARLHDEMTLMNIYLISVSINRMLISQLKRFLCEKIFHLDSMFNLLFISHFYAVVIRIMQMFQTQDAAREMPPLLHREFEIF